MTAAQKTSRPPAGRHIPDGDALLCALVLAPHTYSRNRFFGLYERAEVMRIRRRAARVRGIIRQLTTDGPNRAQIVGEQVFEDRVLLRYSMDTVSFVRTTSLARLEAALVHFALHKSSDRPLHPHDQQLVEGALARLSEALFAEGNTAQLPDTDASQ